MNRTSSMRRASALVAGVGLIAASLVGCSSSTPGSDGDAKTSITVLMEDVSYTNNIKAMLPDFEKESGIGVKIETVPYSDMSAKILQEFSQRSDYFDAVFIDNVYGSGYFASKYIENLKPYADKDKTYGDLSSFYEPYLNPMTTGAGETYGLPVYGESTFLMYRKDLFEQYGIEVPKTTDDLMQAAKTVKEKSGGKIAGITLRGAPGVQSVYPWAGILRSFGGTWYTQDHKMAIADDPAVKATEFWGNILRNYGPSGAANFDWEQNRIAFTQGTAAMTIDATANGPFNEDPASSKIVGKVGYAPIPYAPGISPTDGDTNNSLNVHALYMSDFGKHKDATWKFMSWATSEKVQENAVKTTEAVGATNQKVLEGTAYAEKYGAFQDAVMKQLETGNVNYIPGGQDANTIIVETGQALSNVLSGQASPKDALTAAAAKIDPQLTETK